MPSSSSSRPGVLAALAVAAAVAAASLAASAPATLVSAALVVREEAAAAAGPQMLRPAEAAARRDAILADWRARGWGAPARLQSSTAPPVVGTGVTTKAAAAGSYYPAAFGPLDDAFCLGGAPYRVSFDVEAPAPGSPAYVRVDQQGGFHDLVCNVDGTDLEVQFSGSSDAAAFRGKVAAGNPLLTGAQGKAECGPNQGLFRQVSFANSSIVERRVRVWDEARGGHVTTSVFGVRVRVFKAAYDHIIKSGTIAFNQVEDPRDIAFRACEPGFNEGVRPATATPEGRAAWAAREAERAAAGAGAAGNVTDPVHFCLGINTNEKCTGPAGPIIFYENQYVTVECETCWLAFHTSVSLTVKLEEFLMYENAFKFNDMMVEGALVAELLASYSWGVSADATIPIIGPTDIIQFWLGPIPFIVGFELPLQRIADASFDASATARAGVTMQWNLGTFQTAWNPAQGWHVDAHEPGLMYKTTIYGEAQFDGSANLGMSPSLQMHLDSFFQVDIMYQAEISANVQGSTTSKQICAAVTYINEADAQATLSISIPWIDVGKSWTWEHTWFDKQGTIAQRCVGANSDLTIDMAEEEPKQPMIDDRAHREREEALKAQRDARRNERRQARKARQVREQEFRERDQEQGEGAAAAAAAAELPTNATGHPIYRGGERFTGRTPACVHGRGHAFVYDATLGDENKLINLPSFPQFKKMDCQPGGETFRIEFHEKSAKDQFLHEASANLKTFLTGDLALSERCHSLYEKKVFLFRILRTIDTSVPIVGPWQVEVGVSASQYDEVFRTADMSLGKDSSVVCSPTNPNAVATPEELAALGGNHTEHICLGLNTNKGCNGAKDPIKVYQGQYLTVDCQNCYFAFQTDVFFDLHVADFWLKSLSGGFKDINLDLSLVMQIIAHIEWNSGTNVTTDVVPPTTILSFAIGPIPVRLWFEIPLRKLAEIQVAATATVSAGATGIWNLGDDYVSYIDGKGWSHVAPTPKIVWKPYVGGVTASFNASAQFGLIPTFGFHVDSVFWTTLEVSPILNVYANGSLTSKTVCASADYLVTATAYAELDMNIPFIYLHIGAWWGPEVVYNSGVKPIASICHKFSDEHGPHSEPELPPLALPDGRPIVSL